MNSFHSQSGSGSVVTEAPTAHQRVEAPSPAGQAWHYAAAARHWEDRFQRSCSERAPAQEGALTW
jgi:hypothetical protein